MLATRPICNHWSDESIHDLLGCSLGDSHGDLTIGVEREVRAVLLTGPNGDEKVHCRRDIGPSVRSESVLITHGNSVVAVIPHLRPFDLGQWLRE